VALANYAAFVDRWLRRARAGTPPLTDRKIYALSGVSTSTLSRWRNAQGTQLPEIEKVRAFCRVVGAPVDEALAALGLTDEPAEATPEAPLPADVQIILRRLADPNTPESEREFIRLSLQMLADRAAASGKARPEAS
jgi:transcriptional regulator with XRE-family HTH domain